jgi:hypothetical protein
VSAPATWDTERAAELARTAYRYAARVYPPDADLEPLGVADRRVLECQERGPKGEGGGGVNLGFGRMTPAELNMLNHGGVGPPPPRTGHRVTLVVWDTEGLDCEGAKYPLRALRGMDVNLWVTHAGAGSFHLVKGGRTTRVGGQGEARGDKRRGQGDDVREHPPYPPQRTGRKLA